MSRRVRTRSGEKTPKQIARELDAFRKKYPHLAEAERRELQGETRRDVAAVIAMTPSRTGGGLTCRAHGVPWRQCLDCSKPVARSSK